MQINQLRAFPHLLTFVWVLAFPALCLTQERDIAFLSESGAAKLFPKQLLEYKLKDLKIKKKSDDWREYSATYKTSKSSPKELKLVINDVLLKGDEHWRDQQAESKDSKTQGHPSRLEKGDDKHTVMVFVGDRFRVDFKSREISAEKLQAMAEKFDFKPVEALAPAAN